ncbi:MAG: (Fe-S)-binding protein [Promethearchaeota archaeon]|nr:MAG: (Fe-S)-binding protein [Candidatus Lokiarchaeota archaeon]
MSEDYKCPCREIDPENFLSNEEILELLSKKDFNFEEQDYYKIFNCIHCNACGTSEERFLLKEKFLKHGCKIKGLNEIISNFEKFKSPFIHNKSRVKSIQGISPESNTLLYLGCFTSVKTPKYAENIIIYLLKENIDFCLLEEEICCGYPILCMGKMSVYNKFVKENLQLFKSKGFKRIITVCPSCYMVFKKHYREHGIEVNYFTDYLKPADSKMKGNLIIQHACPLKNGEIPGIVDDLEDLYRKSGYNVLDEVPRECCGFGVGHQLRVDISEAIAMKRMKDFTEEGGYLKNLQENEKNFITSYCPDAFWVLKAYGRKQKIPFKVKDMCDLLM